MRTLDESRPGEQQSEHDHALQSQAFELKSQPSGPNTLLVTCWGGESENRNFDITVDGQKIATQRLGMDRPNEFFGKEYAVPEGLTRGKSKVAVRFQAAAGAMTRGIFGARMLRK